MNSFETMPLRFRVWDKEKQRWYCPPGTYGSERFHYDVLSKLWRIEFWAEDDGPEKYIISQDTGLKDEDNQSIYTGDILQDGIGHIWLVKYVYGDCIGVDPEHNTIIDSLDAIKNDSRVIGNIWQKPELLEEE